MRRIRNVAFVVLVILVAFSAGSLRAVDYITGPQCDDPEVYHVTFVAWGTAGDCEQDCYDACWDCYEVSPEWVDPYYCHEHFGTIDVTCLCSLIGG